jgi:hypothetical protein
VLYQEVDVCYFPPHIPLYAYPIRPEHYSRNGLQPRSLSGPRRRAARPGRTIGFRISTPTPQKASFPQSYVSSGIEAGLSWYFGTASIRQTWI